MEKHFVECRATERELCSSCFRENRNFIPCLECPDAMFCDAECMNRNLLHRWECGSSLIQLHKEEKLCIRSVLMAIESFRNFDDLMEFVENALAEDPKSIPAAINDLQSNYHFFFKLKAAKKESPRLHEIYKCVTSIPKLIALFDNGKKLRFLMHLVTHHKNIISNNAIGGDRSKCLSTVFSMVNHSCVENLYNYAIGDQNICETIRFVKSGEQLFLNYLGGNTQMGHQMSKEGRQMELKSRWDFDCKCIKCEQTCMAGIPDLLDPCYKLILQNKDDKSKFPELLEKCGELLNKRGRLPWSLEIEFISHTFAFLTQELHVNSSQ